MSDDDVNHFHSSGYAETAQGRSIGAGSTQSYQDRLRIERSRRHIRHYGHSMLGRPANEIRPLTADSSDGTARTRLQTGSPRPESPIVARPQGFREPPTRGYNPYS
jgi:hypothetical protein